MTSNIDQYRYDLYGNFWQILDFTKRLVFDFERIFNNDEIKKNVSTIEDAYVHLIFINFSKIFSESKNETFSLDKFKNVIDKKTVSAIDTLKNDYKDIISKMVNNRHNFGAHLGKDFTRLLFSDKEVERRKKNFKFSYGIDFDKLKAKSKDQERYTATDIFEDLPKIKELLDKLNSFWEGILPQIVKK